MVPRTFPSSFSRGFGRMQMRVRFLTSVVGMQRWTDYIPVKLVEGSTSRENEYANTGFVSVDIAPVSSTDVAFKDYVPVYVDSAATVPWQVSANGYIPYSYSGFAGASLVLDFTNNAPLDSRITFTRASSGTYFDSAGTLKRSGYNLLLRSAEFDNASWTKTRSSVTANAVVAPDGTLAGDTLVEDTTASNSHFIDQTASFTSGTAYTYTVYAKNAGRRYLQLLLTSPAFGANIVGVFDLVSGTNTQNSGSTTMVLVGNGWYRCSLTATATATSGATVQLRLADSLTTSPASYTGDGTSGIYIWGAQLEAGSSASEYSRTTTTASGGARLTYNPVTLEPQGLLIEEQRTNLLVRSAEFDNASWTKSNASVTANTNIAPDGTLTADTLVENTALQQHVIYNSGVSVAAGTTLTNSVYVKAAGRSFVRVDVWDGGSNFASADFNLTTGVVGTSRSIGSGITFSSASITNVGNGWYRCSTTVTTSVITFFYARYQILSADNVATYTGDGTSGIYIWGAQLEAGAFATSYIPTVAAQVTRSADSASMTGTNFSSWYTADQGTLYAEFAFPQAYSTAPSAAFAVDDGTANNELVLRTNTAHTSFGYTAAMNGVVITNVGNVALGTMSAGVFGKSAIAFKSGDSIAVANGTLGTASTTAFAAGALTTARIGNNRAFNQPLNGTVKKIAYYPIRNTNAQVQALTTV